MKITEKDKKVLQLLFIFIIIALTVIDIFYSQIIITDKFSLKTIEEKRNEFNSLDGLITSNETMIKNNKSQLETLQTSFGDTQRELSTLRSKISQEDLVFHMPSMLISLEQNAIKNDVELIIEYNLIRYPNDGMAINMQGAFPLKPHNKAGIIEAPINPEGKVVLEQGDMDNPSVNITEALGNYVPPQIKNVDVTVIPIRINGKYSDVRKFIRYLDNLEYVDPGHIELDSDGTTVNGFILVNVFHGGGF